MADAPDSGDEPAQSERQTADTPASDSGASATGEDSSEPIDESVEAQRTEAELEELREQVEAKYDFDEFGRADMAEMEREEWEVAFDADTWITGNELIDRIEKDLGTRIATREVFARLERHPGEEGDRLLAYSDEGYAIVNADGSVEGQGTVLRDVEPTVALCSMEDYDPPEPPANPDLPDPEDVESGTGELGNTMLQIIAVTQMLAGIGLLVAWLLYDLQPNSPAGDVVAPVAGLGFLVIGAFLLLVVANARLSDRFRAEEYRNRLRAVEEAGERPEFVPTLSEAGGETAATPPSGEEETGTSGR
ncbi:MAG: hypothetical protein V5A38_09090 [Halolamina sp.]|uniref:DUF7319 domain-containing protein n=1 Tax=Halolamina sp. TaxID=1940283 RepID=UPI002FC2D698